MPLKIRKDLKFNECLISDVLIGQKKVFYSVCYRSPCMKTNTPEFETFLVGFENLYTNISRNKPYACSFAGDFNAHSLSWWQNGDTNAEGLALDKLLTTLDLSQLISEPINSEDNKSPSSIDLIICDQPCNGSGVCPSPDNFFKHQLAFCNLNLHIPHPPIYSRKIWHYNRANSEAMSRAVTDLPNLENSILLSKVEVTLYLTTTSKFNLRILSGLPTTFEV